MSLSEESTSVSPPKHSKTTPADSYTSKSIEKLLGNQKNEYRVVDNPKKRLSAACWTVFGFPARIANGDKPEIIPGFASCKQCFETFRYLDGSTTSLNEHNCPRILPKGQRSIESSVYPSPQRSDLIGQQIKSKKENLKKLCAQWVSSSMRPFQIVADPGFKRIVQESLNIGKVLTDARCEENF
jgi:hypothetical protein